MKKFLSLILALTMSLSLASCGGSESAETPDEATPSLLDDPTMGLTPFEEPQELKIAFFTGSPLSYPFLFAENLGVFDALNIDVEFTCFTGGPAMMEANSEWDLGSCGLGGVAIGLYGYPDLSLISITDYEENLAIFARADSEIAKDPTNPDVWAGAECVYPAGTTAQAVLVKYLNNMGMSMSDVTSINMDNASALTGFNGGTGDVLGCWNAIALSAEDAGYVRISDSGQLDIAMPCGTFATKNAMENKFDLITVANAVFFMTTEWCYESDENMAQAATWYLEHCDEEGFLCNESVATRTMDWFRGPTVDEWIATFTETAPDDAGLYTKRDLLQAEKDLLVGIDFYIGEGSYTNEDRARYLDDEQVDNSVALAVQELLGK